jgi:hypothetical protein
LLVRGDELCVLRHFSQGLGQVSQRFRNQRLCRLNFRQLGSGGRSLAQLCRSGFIELFSLRRKTVDFRLNRCAFVLGRRQRGFECGQFGVGFASSLDCRCACRRFLVEMLLGGCQSFVKRWRVR